MDDNGDERHLPPALQRTIPENAAEYMIFVVDEAKEGVEFSKPLPRLEAVRKAAKRLTQDLTRDYIWHRNAFSLEVVSRNGLLYLHGITDYGDCVDDEWLIVYLLRELSRSFAGVWARISDSDGEFLLVEAAKTVPKWLSPDMDSNRVWIHNGKLMILPPAAKSNTKGDIPAVANSQLISTAEAVQAIKSTPGVLLHIPTLEEEAFFRLRKYPEYIVNFIHYSRAVIPRKVAYMLHDRPQAIAAATEAFYLRDRATLKRVFASPTRTLRFPPTDLVIVGVKFTKLLFAQLTAERFSPPKEWLENFTAHVPSPAQNPSEGRDGGEVVAVAARKIASWTNLGMKITCGFELMVSTAETSNNRIVREIKLVLDDLREDGDDVASLPTDRDMQSWKDVNRDDDDAWLDVSFDDLERDLNGISLDKQFAQMTVEREQAKGGGQASTSVNRGFQDNGMQIDLQKIVSRFRSFLDDEDAGLEGVEYDQMNENASDDSSSETSGSDDDNVSFDEEEFSHLMREMMGLPPTGPTSVDAGHPTAAATASKSASNTRPAEKKKADSKPGGHSGGGVEDEEDEHILQLTAQFEAELKGHGALRLDSSSETKQLPGISSSAKDTERQDSDHSTDESEIDVDYNLAKNLLESFKGQEGMSGPAGNILNMLGLSLPRDDDVETGNRGGVDRSDGEPSLVEKPPRRRSGPKKVGRAKHKATE